MAKKRTKYFDKLNAREQTFVKAMVDSEAPSYMNQTKSVMTAYNPGNYDNARKMGSEVANRPRVALALKEALSTDRIDNLITKGILERLEDPGSRHWQPTADYVSKIRGDFAPEKQVIASLTPEDRDKKYQDILDLLNNTPKGETNPGTNDS